MDCFAALAMTVGESAILALPLPPRKERLERRHRFPGAHPFAEQMAFLVDPARHVLRLQFQQFSRDRDRLSRQRADFAGHLRASASVCPGATTTLTKPASRASSAEGAVHQQAATGSLANHPQTSYMIPQKAQQLPAIFLWEHDRRTLQCS
jgi:hypothetical protein